MLRPCKCRSGTFLSILCVLACAIPARGSDSTYTFRGKVVATTVNGDAGAAGLSVTLTPPKKLNKPALTTTTNEHGAFELTNVDPGEYLLEIFQRLTVLYREVVTVPDTLQKEVRLNPDLDSLVDQIDLSDAQARLKPVNTLADDLHYPTPDVVSAILQRLELEPTKPLSAQGEINALVILTRRTDQQWLPGQVSRAQKILTRFHEREQQLNSGQKWAIEQLTKALNQPSVAATAAPHGPRAAVGAKGFCYLGRFAENTWKTQYLKFSGDHLPKKAEIGVVSYPVNLRNKASPDGQELGTAQIGQKLRMDDLAKHDPDLYWAQMTVVE